MGHARRRMRNYHRHASGGKRLPVWGIVAICAAVAIALTVLVGNLLRLWLDDETYERLTSTTIAATEAPKEPSRVRNLHAYPFTAGQDVAEAATRLQLSFSLNSPQGALQYTSPVATHYGMTSVNSTSLSESVGAISAYGGYLSGVFYPQALLQSGTDLRYAVACEESALMREFLQSGGNELLLVGLPYATESRDGILWYVRTMKSLLGDAPLGVAVPLSVVQGEGGGLLLEQLLQLCDFCALDMRTALVTPTPELAMGMPEPQVDEALKQIAIYLNQYDMRLLLQEGQQEWITTVEHRLVEDYQIVSCTEEERPAQME